MMQVIEGGISAPLLKQELDSVTIVGMGPTSSLVSAEIFQGRIPHDDRNPIWVINAAAKAFNHSLAWNVHDLNILAEKEEKAPALVDWYTNVYKRPVVTLRPVPGMVTLIYPLKPVVEYFQDDYWFAAPSYMLAYAAWCGVKKVRLYGLDFDYVGRTEYEAGRACTEYWCGRIRTLGVKFEAPQYTSLFDLHWRDTGGRIGYGAPFYGYFGKQPEITYDEEGKMTVNDSHAE